jgi:hypothetical protein
MIIPDDGLGDACPDSGFVRRNNFILGSRRPPVKGILRRRTKARPLRCRTPLKSNKMKHLVHH